VHALWHYALKAYSAVITPFSKLVLQPFFFKARLDRLQRGKGYRIFNPSGVDGRCWPVDCCGTFRDLFEKACNLTSDHNFSTYT